MNPEAIALEERAQIGSWRPLLRAVSLTGAAAVTGAALSALATKIFASMLGPTEVAVLATLQQIRQAGVTGATLNGQTALVQGLSARSGRARREFLRTVLLLMGAATAVAVLLMLLAAGWVASATGLGGERLALVRWMAAPVGFSCTLVFLSAMLNARGAIGRLALVQLAAPAAMALLAYPAARSVRDARGGHEGALVGWLAASAACAAALSLVLVKRQHVQDWLRGAGQWRSQESARAFLTMSGSMFAGGAAASLVLLAARARILHQQGFWVAGHFDAAWAISMSHVSLILGSLQTYCLPALARTADRAARGRCPPRAPRRRRRPNAHRRAGSGRIVNARGLLVANVAAGSALAFEPKAPVAAAQTRVSGTLSEQGGHFLLTDRVTRVTMEFTGQGLKSHRGQVVQIGGQLNATATPVAGASQVIAAIDVRTVAAGARTEAGAIIGGVASAPLHEAFAAGGVSPAPVHAVAGEGPPPGRPPVTPPETPPGQPPGRPPVTPPGLSR